MGWWPLAWLVLQCYVPRGWEEPPHPCLCRCWAESLVLPVMPHHVPISYIMPSYPIITCHSLMSLHAPSHPALTQMCWRFWVTLMRCLVADLRSWASSR